MIRATLRNKPYDIGRNRSVAMLNVLRRGELSAAKCYQRVLRKQPRPPGDGDGLQECLDSHRRRAADLATEIFRRGGIPATGPGLIGRLLALVAALLALLGEKVLPRWLERLEVNGIARYDKCWKLLDDQGRDVLTSRLFPQQVLTRQSVGLLNQSARGWDAHRT